LGRRAPLRRRVIDDVGNINADSFITAEAFGWQHRKTSARSSARRREHAAPERECAEASNNPLAFHGPTSSTLADERADSSVILTRSLP
jgi:hypothetical protein